MDQSLSTALLVLLIGMITVFVVLLCVVLTGRLIISLVNRYSYDKLTAAPTLSFPDDTNPDTTSFDQKKLAVLSATVEVVTRGRGKISKIEKI